MSELRFDGRVAIVTGAGNGLGRSHALLLASRGAKVVVNDLGGGAKGDDGKSSSAADKVVAEIRAAGGQAVANYDSVENGEAIVKTALDAFGTVDIVVNNAGILRDVSFGKMTTADWDLILKVHLTGSKSVTQAAWPIMREKGYGRVIMTTSAAGIYGNFGQANYCAAKLGLLGLANCLAEEGRSKNIHVNTIAPIAASRLTETVMPADLLANLKPEVVSPLVAWLCHESCEETKGLFEVGAGYLAKLRWERTLGHSFPLGKAFTPDDVAKKWSKITDFNGAEHPASTTDSAAKIFANISNPSLGGNEFVDLDVASKTDLVLESSYDENDLALYALGIGAARDPLDASERKYVYEMDGGFQAFPTFAVMPQSGAMLKAAKEGNLTLPGMNFGLDRLLHGEQYTEIKRPLPRNAKLTHKFRMKHAYDKNPNAVIVFGITSLDEHGEEVAYNEMTAFVKGAGGWGGDRGPSADINVPPARDPDAVIEEKTDANQTLLYRLSGDWNPLHADPAFATAFGYEKPILHGLCTFGHVGRHVIKAFCNNDGRYFKSIKVRFAKNVYPGETLVTRMWKESDTRVVFETSVKERNEVVIKNAAIELYKEIPAVKPRTVSAAPASAVAKAAPAQPAGMSPEVAFSAINAYLAANPDVVKRAQATVQVVLSEPDSQWVLDLKNGAGGARAGSIDKPDVTMKSTTADYMEVCEGKADAQKLFFAGKLKLEGNMMVAQKLDFLRGIDRKFFDEAVAKLSASAPAAAEPVPAEPAGLGPQVAFAAINGYILGNPDVVKKAGATVQVNLTDPESQWVLDLKNGSGGARAGSIDKPDVTMTAATADFMEICEGKADAQKLFFAGKLKLAGNMMVAQKLDFLRSIDRKYFDDAVAKLKSQPAAATAAPATAAKAAKPAKAADIFALVARRLAGNEKLAKEVGAVLQFRIRDPEASWVVDLSGAKPDVKAGEATKAAAVFTLSDETLSRLAGGADPRTLYQKGELKVDGDVAMAHRIGFLKA